jgi:uncharacterized protein YrzB (UPF0473 family)
MAEKDEHITIEYDDGTVKEWAVVGVFDAEGREYIALLDEDTEEIYLYRYIQTDEDSYDIDEIPTDEEFDMAYDVFEEILEEKEED